MERHFYLGLTILLVLLVLCVTAAMGINAIHKPAETALDRAASLALEGAWDEAVPLAESAYQRWSQFRHLTAAFTDHSPMDTTENLFQEMLVYTASGEVPHFAACCTQLSKVLDAICDTHTLSLGNFL